MTETRRWVIDLPWDAPPVKANGGHGHWATEARKEGVTS